MKKRIAFIDQNLGCGGAERVLCTILRGLPVEQFDVHLILVGNVTDLMHLIPGHVNLHELGINNTRKALWPFVKKMREIKPEIVFTSLERTAILTICSRLFCFSFKHIARYPTMPSAQIRSGEPKDWRFQLTQKFFRLTDVAVAQTPEMAEELKNLLGIPVPKVRVISNPIDCITIDRAIRDAPSPFPREGRINVVASGRLRYLKGFDVLIEAIGALRLRMPNLHLHILGHDSKGTKRKLQEQARKLGCDRYIHFHGYQSNPYIYYKNCDLFVLSSRYEGMPNVVLECLYLGVPVVATRCVPVIERLINEGRNGYLVDIEDVAGMTTAIEKALQLDTFQSFVDDSSLKQYIDLFT